MKWWEKRRKLKVYSDSVQLSQRPLSKLIFLGSMITKSLKVDIKVDNRFRDSIKLH